jgi:superfamily II DNA/RNA helicase
MPPTFAQLGVPDPICRALSRRGIHEPFEIQATTIADALAGRDVCGRAPTGSGKTLAFGVPLVATVARGEPRRPRGLILAPTRELADQIATELRSFSGDVRVGVVYGGVGYSGQLAMLRRGVDVVVACPGRLQDLVDQGAVSLVDVDKVVIDEADRMADMGFLPVVERLLDRTSPDRQTMLFSATLDGDVARLTRRYQTDPVTHEVGEAAPDIATTEHRFWRVDRADRVDASVRVINHTGPAIVFCRTRHGSDRLARQLTQRGVSAAAIHGGHAQNRRTRTLAEFTDGRLQALVATDVAARGIHVDGVAAVIHFDPPADDKAYIHRSGRTARAGRSGLVVSLVQADQIAETKRIKRQLGLDLPITAPDMAAAPVGPSRAPSTPPRPAQRRHPERGKGNGARAKAGAKPRRSAQGHPGQRRRSRTAGRRNAPRR